MVEPSSDPEVLVMNFKRHEASGEYFALPDDAVELIRGAGLAFLATVNDDGSPNLSPKGSLKVLNRGTLAFGHIASPNSIANIRRRPRVEINVVHPLTREGYRFKGAARLSADSSVVGAIIADLDRDYGIVEAVVIEVDGYSIVQSPRYSVYGDTVDDVVHGWGTRFANEAREVLQLEARLARYVDAWHSHVPEAVAALHTQETEFISRSFGRHAVGQEQLVAALRNIFQLWPDLHFKVYWSRLSPDVFVTESTATATQARPLTLGDVTVQPTRGKINFDFVDIFEFEKDLVRSKRTYFDPLAYIRAAAA